MIAAVRGEKFRYVCERILHIEYTTDEVARAPEIPGASEFLRQVSDRQTALLSSTPHAILLEILRRKGWQEMFKVIQGAPVVKRNWLTQYRLKMGFAARDILLFGDTEEDENSAREAGCSFVRIGVDIKDFTSLS